MLKREKPQEQIELFSKTRGSFTNKKKLDRHSKFPSIVLSIDSIVIISIGIILAIIVSFSVGIEKGRKTSLVEITKFSEKETNKKNMENLEVKQQIKEKKEKKTALVAEKNISGKYTIQVASYKKTSDANKEIKKLEKEGYKTTIIIKGNWKQVCVGDFSNKKQPIPVLKKLRKKYRDCFIKPLP